MFFETPFRCIAQAVLELTLLTKPASISDIRLPLPLSSGTKGVFYHYSAQKKKKRGKECSRGLVSCVHTSMSQKVEASLMALQVSGKPDRLWNIPRTLLV